jgi:hypothetical protein
MSPTLDTRGLRGDCRAALGDIVMNALMNFAVSQGRRQSSRIALATLLAIVVALAIPPLNMAARATTLTLACAPVTGTFVDAMGATGTLEGCFTGEQLVVASDKLALQGALSMELSDRSGQKFATLDGMVMLPVSVLDASSGIYDLSLAPSEIVVAGLQAHVGAIDVELPPTAILSNWRANADPGWTCGLPRS